MVSRLWTRDMRRVFGPQSPVTRHHPLCLFISECEGKVLMGHGSTCGRWGWVLARSGRENEHARTRAHSRTYANTRAILSSIWEHGLNEGKHMHKDDHTFWKHYDIPLMQIHVSTSITSKDTSAYFTFTMLLHINNAPLHTHIHVQLWDSRKTPLPSLPHAWVGCSSTKPLILRLWCCHLNILTKAKTLKFLSLRIMCPWVRNTRPNRALGIHERCPLWFSEYKPFHKDENTYINTQTFTVPLHGYESHDKALCYKKWVRVCVLWAPVWLRLSSA